MLRLNRRQFNDLRDYTILLTFISKGKRQLRAIQSVPEFFWSTVIAQWSVSLQ